MIIYLLKGFPGLSEAEMGVRVSSKFELLIARQNGARKAERPSIPRLLACWYWSSVGSFSCNRRNSMDWFFG